MRVLQPGGWARPRGYANGIEAEGRLVFVAGQIGWDKDQRFVAKDFAGQFEQALLNIVAVLAEAGAGPEHVVRLTWFVTDKKAYLADGRGDGGDPGLASRKRELYQAGQIARAGLAHDLRAVVLDRARRDRQHPRHDL